MELSVLIAARNEEWLARTVESVLAQRRGATEVIVVADGSWPNESIPDHPHVKMLYHASPIGQRAAINQAARLARGQFIMKLDAHCLVDEGFDVKLIEPYTTGELEANVTTIPRMYNLHVFDWVCKCGKVTYQGPMPTACVACDSHEAQERVIRWAPRWSRRSDFFRFDSTLHFQYWGSCESRPGSERDIADVMSMLGASWMMQRERFWKLGGCDEGHGSWGQMGTELACKSWLSGGRLVVNKRTWFSHLFRTQSGFGFPYPLSDSQIEEARRYSRATWLENRWPGQVKPLSWLLERFAPVPGWHEAAGDETRRALDQDEANKLKEERLGILAAVQSAGMKFSQKAKVPTFGVVYYTENRPDPTLLNACRRQLLGAVNGHKIISVSINGPAPIGEWPNVVLDLERSYLTMFKQILAGLEAMDADIVFFAEHDVLYHPSHFEFRPPRDDCYYYNRNVWKVDWQSGRALHYLCDQTSQLCAHRSLLLAHYKARVERVEREGFTRQIGFEPGTRKVRHGGIDDVDVQTWMSRHPNIDVRHGSNLTSSRWSQDQFRNRKYCQGWTEAEVIPGWGVAKDVMQKLRTGGDF